MGVLISVIAISLCVTMGAMVAVIQSIKKQRGINEALAHYVAADLKQTWQQSAEELVKAIRGDDALDYPNFEITPRVEPGKYRRPNEFRGDRPE